MDCKEIKNDLLHDHGQQPMAEVALHLKSCGPCAARFDEIAVIARGLRKLAPPADLMAKLDDLVLQALDCAKLTNDLLHDHAAKSLPRDERKKVEHHLKKCAACAARFDEIRTIGGALRKLASAPAPAQIIADLDDAVMRSLRPQRTVGRNLLFAFAGVAAAALLILGVVAWADSHREPEETPIVVTPLPPPPDRKPDVTPDIKPEPKPEPRPELVNKVEPPVNSHPKPEPEREPDVLTQVDVEPVRGAAIDPAPPPVIASQAVITAPEPASIPVVAGDLNGDGRVDIADRMMLASYLNDGGEINATLADLNGDGRIDIADVQMIVQLIADRAP